MKILITGFNKNQCTRQFYLKQQLKVVPSHYSLYNCLVDMGHEVDQKVVELGEDISQYDKVICFIAAPRQLVTTTLYNGLYAISQARDLILAVDDWQADDLFKGVEKCLTTDDLICDFVLDANKKTKEEIKPFIPDFIKALRIIEARKTRMLISAFSTEHLPDDYGAHTIFSKSKYPKELVYQYNPNPYHRNRSHEDNFAHDGKENPFFLGSTNPHYQITNKEMRMNFASLVQSRTKKWLKNQGFTGTKEEGMILNWPIDLYGSRKESQKRLTEDDMCRTIARDWVTMMPEYEQSKSGWWRARPLQCAMNKSILICGQDEMKIYYGVDYPFFNLNAKNVQQFKESELEKIQSLQRDLIFKIHPLDKNKQQEELNKVLY